MHLQQNPFDPLLIYHQLTYGAQNHFTDHFKRTPLGPLVVCPLMPTPVAKIAVRAGKLCLQHNWPEKLPKYLTQKCVIYKVIDFWGSESISVPQPVLMNCKGLEQPKMHFSNAISMATKDMQ